MGVPEALFKFTGSPCSVDKGLKFNEMKWIAYNHPAGLWHGKARKSCAPGSPFTALSIVSHRVVLLFFFR